MDGCKRNGSRACRYACVHEGIKFKKYHGRVLKHTHSPEGKKNEEEGKG